MALTNLQKQLVSEVLQRELARLEQENQGTGWAWLMNNVVLETAAARKAEILALVDAEKAIRLAQKAERPNLVTQADANDDEAVTLIEATKAGL